MDIIIPVYKPDEKLSHLVKRLQKQTVPYEHIYMIYTRSGSREYDEKIIKEYENVKNLSIHPINKEDFDHGATRNYGVSLSKSDYVMMMTQDAVPANEYLLEQMMVPFGEENVAIVYARQLPNKQAGVIERYTRSFNYPEEDQRKTKQDLARLGIKTYFCSDVCAMYRRDVFERLGKFVTKTIFNEDAIMASKVIGAGYTVAYAASAEVIHSHKYTYVQQFTRNFDLGVSHKDYYEIFGTVSSESEGIKLVKQTMRYLISNKKAYLIPDLILQSGFKFLGYQLGKRYDKLPKWLVLKCSMSKSYWKER